MGRLERARALLRRRVAETVANSNAWRDIVLEATGIGAVIVANRNPDIRVVAARDLSVARKAREAQNSNVLALRVQPVASTLLREILCLRLETSPAGGSPPKTG